MSGEAPDLMGKLRKALEERIPGRRIPEGEPYPVTPIVGVDPLKVTYAGEWRRVDPDDYDEPRSVAAERGLAASPHSSPCRGGIMSKMQARFYVARVEKFAGQARTGWADPKPMGNVTLLVVTGGRTPENEMWASATPSGELKMTVNGVALEWFENLLGEDIAITLERRADVDGDFEG